MLRKASVSESESLQVAVEHHDDGWQEYDRIPRTEEGNLIDYRSVPLEEHLEILERSVSRCVERDSYAGWLVSRHGCSFHESKSAKRVRNFLEKQESLRRDLEPKIDRSEQERNGDFNWLQFTDAVSLFVLDPWSRELEWDREHPGTITVRSEGNDHFSLEGPGFDSGEHQFEYIYRRIHAPARHDSESLAERYRATRKRDGTVTITVTN
jgi:hypothetical protein